MSKENITDVESTTAIKDYCSTKMKFKTYSLKWTIDNYDFVSKTVKLLESPEFPLDGEETKKWYIEFEPPEINETNEIKCSITVMKKEGIAYVHGSLSFIGSSGKIYRPGDYKGLCTQFYWNTITGKQLNTKLLWNETSGKTLILLCEVRVLDTTENYLYRKISIKPFESEDFLQEMNKFFFNDQTFQDVIITVQGKAFRAHKVILAARSKVFAAMFSHEMSENINKTIEIKDLKPETVEKMLGFIYSDKIDDLDLKELATELIAAADKYDLKRLKEICIEALHKNLGIHNALETLKAADMYLIPDLKKLALNFVSLHRQMIKNVDEYEPFFAERPHLMLELIDIQDNRPDNSDYYQENVEVCKATLYFKTK